MREQAAPQRPTFTACAEAGSRLRLAGELDLATVETLSDALSPLISAGGTITLDVTELTFMDSSGIHLLCDTAERIGERGRVVLLDPTPAVQRVVEICGVSGIIDLTDAPAAEPPS